MNKVWELTGPAYWASAIINGDRSGLEPDERQRLDAWLARELGPNDDIVDVARDDEGQGLDPRFTWDFDLHGGECRGGEVIDYIVHTRQGG
jgi:hypothetical protein